MANHNPGFITASTCSAFLTGKGSTLLAGGIEAALKIADERLHIMGIISEYEQGFQGNDATEWGNMHEPDAVARYERLRFVTVDSKQARIVKDWLSCTPDGLIGEDGMIEVKCPYAIKNHRATLIDPSKFIADNYDQCQFQMMLSGRQWNDLVSYDPRFIEPLDISIHRIEADPVWQASATDRFTQAEAVIKETVKIIQTKLKEAS